MKRVLFISIFLFSALSFAESYFGKNAVVDSPDVTALSALNKTERDSIQSMVKSNLESNVQDYFGMNLTGDAQTTERIKKTVARQSESGAYKDGGVEIGAFEHSYFLIETKVLKVGSSYSISATFHDLTTNTHTTVATRKQYSKIENLASHPGAVDEVTILLGDKLGISLSPLDRHALQSGSSDFTQDQQIARANSQLETIKKQQEELKKQAQAAASSTDLNSKTEQARIQAQIEDLESRQKQAEAKARRLAQEKAVQDEEKARNSARSAEQQKRIIEEAREVERLAAQVRSQKMQSASVFAKFRLLEDKKQALLNLKQDMNSRIKEIEKERDDDISKKRNEILSREYRRAEMSGGKPTETALKARQQEAKNAGEVISQQARIQIMDVRSSYQKSIQAIAEDIVDGYEDLEDGQYEFSSIATPDELVYVAENFDGAKMGWPITVYLYSSGVNISSFHLFIPYKNLYKAIEEKEPKLEGEEFYDAVDRYDSLFAQKSKFINCELKVNESVIYNSPSRYLTTNEIFTITSIKTGNVILTEKTFEYQKQKYNQEKKWWYTFNSNKQDVSAEVDPIIRERSVARQAEKNRKLAEEAEKQRQIKLAKKAEERKAAKEKFRANQKSRTGIFTEVGISSNDSDYNGVLFGVDVLFGKKYLFYGVHADYMLGYDVTDETTNSYVIAKNNSKYKTLTHTDYLRCMGLVGATVQLGIFRPHIYIGAGYYQNTYRADAVKYEEDPRYGSGGTLASGASILFGGGFEFGKKFTFGFDVKTMADIGAGSAIAGSFCFGYKFW